MNDPSLQIKIENQIIELKDLWTMPITNDRFLFEDALKNIGCIKGIDKYVKTLV
jgi:hypothetical protein